MSDLRIQPATPDQAEEVAALVRAAFAPQIAVLGLNPQDHHYYAAFETADLVRERMQRGTVAVGYAGDRMVGTVGLEVNPEWLKDLDGAVECGWIERLAVLPEFRGRAYGEALMAWAEARLREQGVARIRLAIVKQFDRLEAFYERLGYRPIFTTTFELYPYEVLFMEKAVG
jgi:GNAT superfamily N-acetyltransferase